MKFKPRKGKVKKQKKRIKQKHGDFQAKELKKTTDFFQTPRDPREEKGKFLNIQLKEDKEAQMIGIPTLSEGQNYITNRMTESQDFCRIEEMPSDQQKEENKLELSLRDIRIENTQEDEYNRGKRSKFPKNPNLVNKPAGSNLINVMTSGNEQEKLNTPKPEKEETDREIDFRLTSSREMDLKYKSIFHPERQGKVAEPRREQEYEEIPKSPEPRFSQLQEISPFKNMKEYVNDMDVALKKREKQEKEKLKNMLKNKRISDSGFKRRKYAIDKWVSAEKKQIKQTKNMLIQGWMKANEIIGHLKKDKNKVYSKIEERIGRLSPTSKSSNLSRFSFCRSENSFGGLNNS